MKCIISLFKMNPGNLISAWFCLEYEPIVPATTTTTKSFNRKWKAFGICVLFFFVVGLYHLFFIGNFLIYIWEYNSIFFFHCMCHWHHLWWQKIQFSHRKMTLKNTWDQKMKLFTYWVIYLETLFKKENIRKSRNRKIRNKHQI